MASRKSARSVTFRAIGPSIPRVSNGSDPGPQATRPGDGRIPTIPLKLAGLRSEPPRSEPWASQAMPVASATADPPDDPAAESAVFHGLSVAPNTVWKVLAPAPNSGVFDYAAITPPAASSVVTTKPD